MNYTASAAYAHLGDSGFVTYYLDYPAWNSDRPGRKLWIQVRLNGLYTRPIPACVDDFGNVVALTNH